MPLIGLPGLRYRRLAVAAVVALFLGSIVANYYDGSVGLRPVSTICVILFTLYTGWLPGLAAAVVATIFNAWLGFAAPWASVASKNPLTTVIFLITNVVCALVAAGLRTGRRDRVRLNQLQATQS